MIENRRNKVFTVIKQLTMREYSKDTYFSLNYYIHVIFISTFSQSLTSCILNVVDIQLTWRQNNGTRTKRHGQNGPDKTDHVQDKTDHVSGQNGPRFRTKWTTFRTKRTMFHDQRDQVSGPNGPRSGPNGPRSRTKWTKLNDKLSFVYRITFALKYLLQCSDGQWFLLKLKWANTGPCKNRGIFFFC